MQYTIQYLRALKNYTIVSYHRPKYPSRSESVFLSFENLVIKRRAYTASGQNLRDFKQTKKDDPQVVFLYWIAMMGPISGRNRHSDISEILLS